MNRDGTMHAMKGLGFRCMAAGAVEADAMPASAAVTPEDEDPVAYHHDLQRERCLLFVVCPRARDSLYVSYVESPSPFLPSVPGRAGLSVGG